MKEFIIRETKKAMGRLKDTLVGIVKGVLFLAINAVIWLMPLAIMGYLGLTLLLSAFDNAPRTGSFRAGYPQAVSSQRQKMNLSEMLQYGEDFWRTLQNFRRF